MDNKDPEIDHEDPEDILSTSLETFYGYQPITFGSAGTTFTYGPKGDAPAITLQVPDTAAANWSLHASDIWVSSIYLADHLDDLHIPSHIDGLLPGERLRLLELGAAAGLPGILIAKTFPNIVVTVSDYPDEQLIRNLANNVARNGVADSCRTAPYAWGSDSSALIGGSDGFDVVIAADTLWNPELHELFVAALRVTLRKSPSSRIYIVAGLHTGRYTIQAFLRILTINGFEVETIAEIQPLNLDRREWSVSREGEDDRENRRWVVWLTIKWLSQHTDVHCS